VAGTRSKHAETFRQFENRITDIRLQLADNRTFGIGAFAADNAGRTGNRLNVDADVVFGTALKAVCRYFGTVGDKSPNIVGLVNDCYRRAGRAADRRFHPGRQSLDVGLVFGFHGYVAGVNDGTVADISLSVAVRVDMNHRSAGGKHGGNDAAHALAVNIGFGQSTQ